ncbi:antitoxin VapB family protein [Haloferax sp. ATB1]|uniref:antitoxin VapB family protein n=1 Tax=Haloferax sp. ATB1 TaxID=1508454 RepID=UPI001F52A89B|nr:antitoxin VapB family protein [Haloferax sp. ATB1]
MSTSIRVSDETKEKLARLKREDESWDEFLNRLANQGSGMTAGAWKGTGKAEQAREAIKRSRELPAVTVLDRRGRVRGCTDAEPPS